jgi:nitrite reductase/ring-hydroxylating ferredoxin subunit
VARSLVRGQALPAARRHPDVMTSSPSSGGVLDLERVVCRLSEVEAQGARAFTIGRGDWPLRGFVVRSADAVRGYVNRCPHAGHPLNLLPERFLTPDGALILCSSHGALFEKANGYCVAGPCAGRSLTPIALEVRNGFVLLADSVDVSALGAMLADGPR